MVVAKTLLAAALVLVCGAAQAQLPTGYLVWSKGKAGDATTRKIYRMTLPGKTDIQPLTTGEDVECQISPDGKWVAFAKAKVADSDYHDFKYWKVYVVSIHGVGGGRKEIKIDDDGAWPSWGQGGELYFNQADKQHTKIIRVELDPKTGYVTKRDLVFETQSAFGGFTEVNEAFMAPDGSWFAARTRGGASVEGVGAYQISPPKHFMLAKAGAIGCMPYVAPSGSWGFIAGATEGIRWGHGPTVSNRKEDQQLIPPKTDHKAYHPGISTDEKWVMASFGTEQDHNAGAYDVHIYSLDNQTMAIGAGEELVAGGFNGWPHIWVGPPTPPPPPVPTVVEFYPSSYTVAPGDKVTLTWATQESETVELDGQSVASDGTQEVTPASTTTYNLVARSSKSTETDSKSCKVTVNAAAQPVSIVSFKAKPETIELGQSTTLSWEVENATTLDLDGQRVAPSDKLMVEPAETTSYALTAQGKDGPVTAEVTVTVLGIDRGLLPDKGGFVCGLVGEPTLGVFPLLLVAAVLLGLARRRSR